MFSGYVVISEELAKLITIYGKQHEDCYLLEGRYRFSGFAVRYRMASPTNRLYYDGALGMRVARDYVTAMQESEPDGVDDELGELEVMLSDLLTPKAI